MPEFQHALKGNHKKFEKGAIKMNSIKMLTYFLLVLIIGLIFAIGERQALALLPDYAQDVIAQRGDPSPAAGYSAGETNSRIDDYINQDEQINIEPKSGVVKVLRTNQKVAINDFVQAVIRCNNVHPRELRGAIRTIVRKEGGDADVVQDKEKNEYFLHVTCPKFQLPYVEAAVRALDEKWVKEREDGSAELYYQAKFRNAADILKITKYYCSPENQFLLDPLNNAIYYRDQPGPMPLQQKGFKDADIPPNQISIDVAIYEVQATDEFKLGLDYVAWKNGPGRNLFTGISQYAKISGHYFVDWRCYPAGVDNSMKLKDLIDKPITKYRYADFNLLATAAYVDFLSSKGKAKLLTKTNVLTKSGTSAEVAAVEQIVSFKPATITPPGPLSNKEQELLVALQQVNQQIAEDKAAGKDVSSLLEQRSKILELLGGKDDKAAKECNPTPPYIPPYPTGIPLRAEYAYNRILNYLKTGSVGVKLNITPYVGLESAEADIDIAVSDVSGFTGTGSPIINTRFLYTYARLKDGVPFILGGITRKSRVQSSGKIPLLGDLPILGWLAGGEQNSARDTELVIVLTPKFIIGSESVLEMPKEAKTVIAQVEGKEPLQIPSNPFGFDQWLLDREK